MEQMKKNLLYISLEGMEVSLASCFFHGLLDRPRNLHIHPCYELICVEGEAGMHFTVIPPLYEHVMAEAPPENVCSLLFSFLDEHTEDICRRLQSITVPTEFRDTFDGAARIRSVKELTGSSLPGTKEQIAAELRLFFVGLARSLCKTEIVSEQPKQTLENERLARLEEYFNIQLKDPNCSKQQLADELGVCERQLTRILKETYHSNFSSILLHSRMYLAQAMIEQGQKNPEEIAAAVGYTSLDTFQKAYKKFFGCLPEFAT